MASLSTSSLSFKAPSIQSTRTSQVLRKPLSFQPISFGRFQSSKNLRLQISCAAKPETVQKVSDIVREQLALSADTALTAESKFSALGADSLDTLNAHSLILCGLDMDAGGDSDGFGGKV
ncbi:acyl carrier protein 4, chloroplastic isoform X2 [Brassica rapa]|uniref:acyl carrier protein 4, chloroplastic isoform X2 n=1 Tax=Brassica campestris TaxID=3711 RepID=UPI00142DD8BB|nr:acyl carrier protein 4, chloroplastic isoform X2 [Brassica rapa]